ncbi:putative claudin-24 [Chanodichthys erythropterus]|uniref:putative claudin-24 n=1 Tax=Chanodichthys erythropterus TaxID=933992 RepID=UPI00351EC9DD
MTNPCTVALEILGMLIGMGGWFCSLAATIMPQWLSLSTECRPYDTTLGLDPTWTLARVLMYLSDATCLLGLLLAIPAMSWINCCKSEEGRRTKRCLKITAAVFLCIAGLLVLTPVSYVAHDAVMKFFDETTPHVLSRSEIGYALFVGWAAGILDIVAAVMLLFTSCTDSRYSETHLVSYHQKQEIRTVE